MGGGQFEHLAFFLSSALSWVKHLLFSALLWVKYTGEHSASRCRFVLVYAFSHLQLPPEYCALD